MSEAVEHQADRGQGDHRLGDLGRTRITTSRGAAPQVSQCFSAPVSDDQVQALATEIFDDWQRARESPALWVRDRPEIQGRQTSLASEFARCMGWTWARRYYTGEELRGKRPRDWATPDLPPHFDHPGGYRVGRRPAALVIQPYDVEAEAEAEMRAWAESRGLVFLLPDFPSWWLPTRTALCVFAAPWAMPSPPTT
jgi:hypothetical protein